MRGVERLVFNSWGARERWMTLAATVAILTVMALAGRGLAAGALGEVMRVRFGGDAERTRIVLDLDRSTRGDVVESGGRGRVVLSLSGMAPGDTGQGSGSGLVRAWRVERGNGGARLNLDLTRGAEIERRFLLPPGDGVDHYRYVVDLKSTGREATAPVRAAPQRRTGRPLIVIDAGHGGNDPGALGADARESAVTLAAAQALKQELERSGRYRVRLTRESDIYVVHQRRVQIARDAGADLFISLHADAGTDPATRGASVYTLSEQGAGRAVREFTREDNWQRSLNLPGRDDSVDRILLDMTQRATQNRSAHLARSLLGQLEDGDHPLLRRSHRDAGLAVLLAPDVPAVLLEMGFITNPEDERVLTDSRARRRLMRTVAAGIDRYFATEDAPITLASTGSAGAP